MRSDLTRAAWRKSARSGDQGACVELADLADVLGIRDSKNPDGPHLEFSRGEVAGLLERVRSGALDL